MKGVLNLVSEEVGGRKTFVITQTRDDKVLNK